MRAFLATVVVGILLGLGSGYAIGRFQASLMPWDPSLEINKGIELAKVGQETPDNKDGTAKGKRGKQPKVKVDEVLYDFGIVEKDPSSEKGEHKFYIENVGDADMTLADGGKGCFCTDFTISKGALKPGEKATVNFTWDGARSGGVFNQGVRVLTNDPDRKEVMFYVKGLYTAPIICDVGEVVFQNASATQQSSRSFRIMGFEKNEDGSPFPLEFQRVEVTDPDHFEILLEPDSLDNLTDEDRKSKLYSQTQTLFQGIVSMKHGMPQGAFQEVIRLHSNSPKTPVLEISLNGQISSNEIRISGRLFDDKDSGQLRLDNVQRAVGKTTSIRLTIFDKIPANENTVKVKSTRPDWINVNMTYPPEELQKESPIRLVEVEIEIPANSPQGAFMGPEKEQLGEIVFSVGETEETSQDVVVPVRFAVSQ